MKMIVPEDLRDGTFDSFVDFAFSDWLHRHNKTPSYRQGQHYMNVLHEMKPHLYEEVTGNEELDPFYDNTKVGIFLEWVSENWDKE